MNLYIATLSEIKAELGITDAADDALLTNLAKGLQGRFEDLCNRRFERTASITEKHTGGIRTLYLKTFPVESVALVTIDGTALDSTNYTVSLERGRLYYGSGSALWPNGIDNITVVYTAGYKAAGSATGTYPMPESLRRALFMQLGYEWRNRESLGRMSMGAQGQNISLSPAKLLPEVMDCLAPFVRF